MIESAMDDDSLSKRARASQAKLPEVSDQLDRRWIEMEDMTLAVLLAVQKNCVIKSRQRSR